MEKEKKAREEALTALEYQTIGKQEALASLKEEQKKKQEAEEKTRVALQAEEEERGRRQQEVAALQAEVRDLTSTLKNTECQVSPSSAASQ